MDVALVDSIEVPRLRGLFGHPFARVTLQGTTYLVRNQVSEWWPGLEVPVTERGRGAVVRLLVESGHLAKGSTVVALGEQMYMSVHAVACGVHGWCPPGGPCHG